MAPGQPSRCRASIPCSCLLSPPCRCSCSPITPPSPKAPTSTSPATSPNPSRWNDDDVRLAPFIFLPRAKRGRGGTPPHPAEGRREDKLRGGGGSERDAHQLPPPVLRTTSPTQCMRRGGKLRAMNADSYKRAAAERALGYVESGMRLGLGTGSTAEVFLELLAE